MFAQNLLTATISTASSGDNTIIAAPGDGKFIAIDHINFIPASAVTVQLKTGSNNYGGLYSLDAKQAFTLENAIANNERGVITCGNNEAFIISLGGNVQTSGFVRYRIV